MFGINMGLFQTQAGNARSLGLDQGWRRKAQQSIKRVSRPPLGGEPMAEDPRLSGFCSVANWGASGLHLAGAAQ